MNVQPSPVLRAGVIRTGNDPILKVVCTAVELGEALPWLDQLKRACRKARNPSAVGLAAPQIGVAKRVIVTYVAPQPNAPVVMRAMINPRVIGLSAETAVEKEGCLSYPGIRRPVSRYVEICVAWLDERRVPREGWFAGFEARVVQHEIDHLNGICRVGDASAADAPFLVDAAAGREVARG